jgi:uncharacterized membrane protein (DUF4010 family)
MDLATAFQQLGIALGLGLLVGLQRERTEARLAGIRTFPLITLFGALSAMLAQQFGDWILAVGLVGLIALLVLGNLPGTRPTPDPGLTSELAMLVMFAVGAFLAVEKTALAVAIGGTVAVLLHLKPEMHRFAARIGERDFKAIMQFVVISLVILPALPNEYFGPYDVLNPFKIWIMVVLIVGISLGGYVIYKVVGPRAGTLVGGMLGGLISSTATTVSYARHSKRAPASNALAAFVIMTASAVVFARVLALIGTTAPGFLRAAAPPLCVMLGVTLLLARWSWSSTRASSEPMLPQENPTELKPAILFGVLYAVVLLVVAAARDYFGQSGLFVVAALSGLTDMDAITLSVTQLVSSGQIEPQSGWRVIVVASMSNLVFKAGTVAFIGDRKLARKIALLFAIAFVGGVLLLLFWPDAAIPPQM